MSITTREKSIIAIGGIVVAGLATSLGLVTTTHSHSKPCGQACTHIGYFPTSPVYPGGAGVYQVPASYGGTNIPNDCSGNVAGVLNSWMASVPNNSTIQFASNGCYEAANPIVLTNRTNLIIDGNGSTFKLSTAQGLAGTQGLINWAINGGTNITLENMTIQGASTATKTCGAQGCGGNTTCQPNSAYEYQYGIDWMGTNGGTATSVNITNVCGDFIDFSPYCKGSVTARYGCQQGNNVWTQPATNIIINGGTDYIAGRQGMSPIDANGVTIENVNMSYVAANGVDIEPSTTIGYEENITVGGIGVGNTFSYLTASMVNESGGGDLGSGNVNVIGNTQTSPQADVPAVNIEASGVSPTPSGFTIQSNNISAFGWQFQVGYVNNVTIGGAGLGNTNTYAGGGYDYSYAVTAADVVNMNVSYNNFYGSATTYAPTLVTPSGNVNNPPVYHQPATITGTVINCNNTTYTGTGQPTTC